MEIKKKESLEDYFKSSNLRVKRGELLEILVGTMDGVNKELAKSFMTVSQAYLTVETIFQVLMDKGIITQDDIEKAKKTVANKEKEKQAVKEDTDNGSK